MVTHIAIVNLNYFTGSAKEEIRLTSSCLLLVTIGGARQPRHNSRQQPPPLNSKKCARGGHPSPLLHCNIEPGGGSYLNLSFVSPSVDVVPGVVPMVPGRFRQEASLKLIRFHH